MSSDLKPRHQIDLNITTGDTVYFLRDNKIQHGLVHEMRISLYHVPSSWETVAETKTVIDVYITIDPIYLVPGKMQADYGFSRRINQVFLTKEDLVQDLVK